MEVVLLENIKKAYKVAVLQEERERFIPLLEKVYLLNPNNIDINILFILYYFFSSIKLYGMNHYLEYDL